jgi:hypothetical protein
MKKFSYEWADIFYLQTCTLKILGDKQAEKLRITFNRLLALLGVVFFVLRSSIFVLLPGL